MKEGDIMKLEILDSMCAITKKVIRDFNSLTDNEFLRKYACRKIVYYRRVMKYGDPYMNAPLSRIAKFVLKYF